MNKQSKSQLSYYCNAFVSLCLCGFLSLFYAQAYQDDELRDITKDWKQKRPGAQSSPKKPPNYSIKTRIPAGQDRPESASDSEIGITLWRYRPSGPADEVRDLIQPKAEGAKEECTLERFDAEAVLSDSEMIRLTIESLRTGYLYIINRAKYDDSTYGDPHLIFPTIRIKEGDNAVRAGRPIQIPEAKDNPPYFKLSCGRSKSGAIQVSEELILLVTPQPIEGLNLGADRMKLSRERVELLKQKYSLPVERSEMLGGIGIAITKQEDLAAKDPLQLLMANDPYPQTIYRVAAKSGDPMLVVVELKVQAFNRRPRQ
jgi:hypothetical protein